MTPNPDLPMGIRWSDRVPLGRVSAATWLLQRSAAEIGALVESGALLWAWDVRSKSADRRELRLWRPCVDALARRDAQPQDAEEAVLRHVLTDGRPWFTTRELSLRWMCSHKHVIRLLDDGLLEMTPDSPRRRGAGGSPHITRKSAAAFLQARRVV
mgnify:FL=1